MSIPAHERLEPRTVHAMRELRRITLRHPGMVKATVAKLLLRNQWDFSQLSAIHTEAVRLGIKLPDPAPGGPAL